MEESQVLITWKEKGISIKRMRMRQINSGMKILYQIKKKDARSEKTDTDLERNDQEDERKS